MTNEERIRGIEDAVIHLSDILEARLGPYGRDQHLAVPGYGKQIHQWVASVNARRSGDQA